MNTKHRIKTILPFAAVVIAGITLATTSANADVYSTGFESGEYTGGTTTGANQLVPQQGWETQFGDANFDVYTYVGNEVAYTPSGEVPDIGGTAQLVTFPQNPTGGSQFVAAGNGNGRDMHAADYTPSAEGLVEISVDYHPGDWFDNSGGNYNGAMTIRPENSGGFYTGRGSEQEPGDANGNGPWAPAFQVWDKDDTKLMNHGIGYRFDEVDGFDNLTRSWYRIGVVIDTNTGIITQLKSQELTPGGATKFIDDPLGPGEEVLYLLSGDANTSPLERIGIYNVGNGTLSAYDNLYVGPPYEWPVVPDSPRPGGSILAFQTAAQSNANLVHQYTFDGADDDARIEDKKGSADLEIKPFGTGTEDDLGLGETGFDGSSQAVSIFRAEGSDHTGGAALHQPSITLGEAVSFEAIFQPRQEEISGGTWNLGYIVATRIGGDRGYFLIQGEPQPSEGTVFTSTIGGSFSHDNTNRILEPVTAGHWYYAAGSYKADPDDGTVTFTNYIADLTAGDAVLTAVGPFTNSGGTYPIGETTLGIGQRWDAGEAFPGLIDEVNLYQAELPESEFQAHLDALTGGGVPFAITEVSPEPGNGAVMITWTSHAGRQYSLEVSDDLSTWEEVDDGIDGESDTTSYVDTVGNPLPVELYYRVLELE